jgi:hypothetical protein
VIAIHLTHQAVNLVVQQLVLGNPSAARHTDLYEHEASGILGMLAQKAINRAQPFRNPFRVIDPVNSDANNLIAAQSQLRAPAIHLFECRVASCQVILLFKIDTDREWPHLSRLASARDLVQLAIDLRFQNAVYCVEKILAVIAQIEPEQIIAQQAVEQFLFPGKTTQHFRIGPGDMPELRDDQIGGLRSFNMRGSSAK